MIAIITLSFGFKKPEDGDKGDSVFNALEGNIEQLNGHDHDGVDTDRVDSFDLRRGSVTVPITGWIADGDLFKQTVTFPAGFDVSNGSEFTKASIRFYYASGTYDKQELFPKYERTDNVTLELFSISSSQDYIVTFV